MRRSLLINSAAGALNSALVPIFALVFLAPAEYGRFSIVYLVFAFGISLQLSLVGEAWVRSLEAPEIPSASRELFFGVLGWVCLVLFIAGIVAGIFAFGARPDLWVLGAAGASLGIQRLGARYHSVYEHRFRRVLASDSAGIALFVLTILVGVWTGGYEPTALVLLAWALSSLAAALVFGLPRLVSIPRLVRWVRERWRVIRVLVTDSTLLDLGNIVTPLVLAGFLGKTNFGIYRGLSSVAVPVSLLMDPLRPSLAKTPARQLVRLPFALLLSVVGLVLAGAAYVVLVVILPVLPFSLGTLNALTPFALAAACYVFFFFTGYPYYIAYRVNSSGREILLGRITQTVFAVVLPLVGFFWDGLNGAIWGFTGTAVVSTFVSVGILWATVRRSKNAAVTA